MAVLFAITTSGNKLVFAGRSALRLYLTTLAYLFRFNCYYATFEPPLGPEIAV